MIISYLGEISVINGYKFREFQIFECQLCQIAFIDFLGKIREIMQNSNFKKRK